MKSDKLKILFIIKLFIVLLIKLALVGCANSSHSKIKKTDLNKLNAIRIDSITREPYLMHYSGPTSLKNSGAFLLDGISEFANRMSFIHPAIQFAGIPFTLSAEYLRISEIVEFQRFIEKDSNILITEIISDELKTQLDSNKILNIVESNNDHYLSILKINIDKYGFSNVIFTSNLNPELNLTASLIDKDGKLIWLKDYKYESKSGSLSAIPLNEVKLFPHLIKDSWHSASRILIASIINDLSFQLNPHSLPLER